MRRLLTQVFVVFAAVLPPTSVLAEFPYDIAEKLRSGDRPAVTDLTSDELRTVSKAILDFVDDRVVSDHALLRELYLAGNGTRFLTAVSAENRRLEAYLAGRGLILPAWNPEMPIPRELAVVELDASGRSRPALRNLNPRMAVPRNLQPNKLASYRDSSELGEAILPWHNQVQSEVGGSMGEVRFAAATPIFWCWHAYVSDIYANWQAQQNAAAPILRKVLRTVANPPLQPAVVELANSHGEDLVVQLVDRREPNVRPTEFLIRAGQSKSVTIPRDAGAEKQLVLINSFGEVTEVLDRQPIASKSYFNLVVYESKIQSVYYDRTLKGRAKYEPQEVTKGLTSFGVFSLPAGDRLEEGSVIDVARDAKFQRNPGAARGFSRPTMIDQPSFDPSGMSDLSSSLRMDAQTRAHEEMRDRAEREQLRFRQEVFGNGLKTYED